MTSRERMLAAIDCRPVDHVPCSFMLFSNLRGRCAGNEEFVLRQIEMGLDAFVGAGFLEPSLHPEASEKVWSTREADGVTFFRSIETPAGPLVQKVRQVGGWPRPDSFCMFNDWIVPRCVEPLVKPRGDLEKLPYLLGPFGEGAIQALRDSARSARELASEHDLLLTGGWEPTRSTLARDDGVMGADAMAWLTGFEEICVLSLTEPELVREYARIIHEWNLRQIEIYLDVASPDLIFRRAWYETTEFWTPAAYRDLLLPFLKREVAVVHQAGCRMGLITTSAFMPILEDILSSGVDVLVGLDPKEGKGTDLAAVKSRVGSARRAIWGGVSGAITVERGSRADTEEAVRDALRALAPGGGFILSPVDNVRDDTPRAWENTEAFIDAWKRHRGAGGQR